MLEFIVLGIVPGTNFIITLPVIIIGLSSVLIVVLTYFETRRFLRSRNTTIEQTDFNSVTA